MNQADFDSLLDRHEAFLHRRKVGKPLIGYWAGGYYPVEQFPRGTSRWRPGQLIRPDDLRFEAFREDYQNLYRIHDQLTDDFFYIGSAYWGIPWLEAIMGCAVYAGKTSAWTKPCLERPAPPELRDGDLDKNPWFTCLLQFTKELVDFAHERFPVCAPLLRGAGDVAAAMRGTETFVLDLIDSPGAGKDLLEVCATVRMQVLARLKAVIPPWRQTHAAGGYPSRVWSKKTVAYYQEDCAAYLNPDIFREFILPVARKMAAAAEVNFMHLHSGCLYPVDILLEDGTNDIIEINIDHEGAAPPLRQLLGVFKKIQHSGKALLLWGQMSDDDLAYLSQELEPAGLSLQPIWNPAER